MDGAKGKGKNCKNGKGDKGKGKQVGIWKPAGDHGGTWVPTRAQLKGFHGGLPYPTQHQYAHPWHAEGKGPQPGTKMLIGAGAEAEEPEDWTAWMKTSGYAV